MGERGAGRPLMAGQVAAGGGPGGRQSIREKRGRGRGREGREKEGRKKREGKGGLLPPFLSKRRPDSTLPGCGQGCAREATPVAVASAGRGGRRPPQGEGERGMIGFFVGGDDVGDVVV